MLQLVKNLPSPTIRLTRYQRQRRRGTPNLHQTNPSNLAWLWAWGCVVQLLVRPFKRPPLHRLRKNVIPLGPSAPRTPMCTRPRPRRHLVQLSPLKPKPNILTWRLKAIKRTIHKPLKPNATLAHRLYSKRRTSLLTARLTK